MLSTMRSTMRPRPVAEPAGRAATVEVVVPVYNEEPVLSRSIHRLHAYLGAQFPFEWRIVIADNGSTDRTREVAASLAAELDSVELFVVSAKGRGRALREAWGRSTADVVAYVDVDLSTGLTGLLPLVAPLVSGHSDVAIGSRLSAGSVVARGPKREVISRSYNLLLRTLFAVRFRDAQCGFKAVRRDVAQRLLPAIDDDAWFFDTELLLLAEHNGLRVHEVPVDWVDDPDSRVDVRSTATDDLRGVWRVLRTFMRGDGRIELGELERKPLVDDFGRQTVTFASIGVASTLATLAAYVLLRESIGSVWANVVAFTGASVFNNWANRRWTFRRRGAAGRSWQVAATLVVFVVPLVLSTIAVAVVRGDLASELAALLVAWAIGGIFRFLVLRAWVYRRRQHSDAE